MAELEQLRQRTRNANKATTIRSLDAIVGGGGASSIGPGGNALTSTFVPQVPAVAHRVAQALVYNGGSGAGDDLDGSSSIRDFVLEGPGEMVGGRRPERADASEYKRWSGGGGDNGGGGGGYQVQYSKTKF